MRAVNTEVITGEKWFPEGKIGGSHQIYSNQSAEIISTVHTEKSQIPKDFNFGNHNNFKTLPVLTVYNKSAYYIQTYLGVQLHVSQ